MTIFQGIIIGIVQGVTEILPVSSTAHIIITSRLLGVGVDSISFDVMMNFASWIAILMYFRDTWLDIIVGTLNVIKISVANWLAQSPLKSHIPRFKRMTVPYTKNQFFDRSFSDMMLGVWVFVASIPALIIGFVASDYIEIYGRQTNIIAFSLIIGGILLWITDKFGTKLLTLSNLSIKRVLIIGVSQSLALIPGFSRSGSVMVGSLFTGLNRESSAKFAFLLGAPVIFVATIVKVPEFLMTYSLNAPIIIAFLSSLISTLLTIHFLYTFIQNHSFTIFVAYRIIVGIILLLYITV